MKIGLRCRRNRLGQQTSDGNARFWETGEAIVRKRFWETGKPIVGKRFWETGKPIERKRFWETGEAILRKCETGEAILPLPVIEWVLKSLFDVLGDWEKGSSPFASNVWARIQRTSQSQWGEIFSRFAWTLAREAINYLCSILIRANVIWAGPHPLYKTFPHKFSFSWLRFPYCWFRCTGTISLSWGLPEKPRKFPPSIPSRCFHPIPVPISIQSQFQSNPM